MANWLVSQRGVDTGCVTGGPDVSWCSVEHNIDAVHALELAGRLTQNDSLVEVAHLIEATLLGSTAWSSIEGRFYQGINDWTMTLDVQSWGTLFLLDDPTNTMRVERAASALAFTNATFRTTQTSVLAPNLEAHGFGPYDPPLAVWSEGSYGVALAYERLGETETATTIDAGLAPLVRSDGAVLYAANTTTASPWGDMFYAYPSVTCTAWRVHWGNTKEMCSIQLETGPAATPRLDVRDQCARDSAGA